MTYILQFFAGLLMIASLAVGGFAVANGHVLLVVINAVIFAVNLSLFCWQASIRVRL